MGNTQPNNKLNGVTIKQPNALTDGIDEIIKQSTAPTNEVIVKQPNAPTDEVTITAADYGWVEVKYKRKFSHWRHDQLGLECTKSGHGGGPRVLKDCGNTATPEWLRITHIPSGVRYYFHENEPVQWADSRATFPMPNPGTMFITHLEHMPSRMDYVDLRTRFSIAGNNIPEYERPSVRKYLAECINQNLKIACNENNEDLDWLNKYAEWELSDCSQRQKIRFGRFPRKHTKPACEGYQCLKIVMPIYKDFDRGILNTIDDVATEFRKRLRVFNAREFTKMNPNTTKVAPKTVIQSGTMGIGWSKIPNVKTPAYKATVDFVFIYKLIETEVSEI